MKKILPGLVAGVLMLVLWPVAALGAPVTVNLRVEGTQATAFEGPVTTDVRTVPDAGGAPRTCDGTNGVPPVGGTPSPTAGGALADSGVAFSATYFAGFDALLVDSIGGETPPDFWAFLVNGDEAQAGICNVVVTGGEEILFAAGGFGKVVLRLAGPPAGRVGETARFTVTDAATGAAVPGAQVGGATTGGDGAASVPLAAAGTQSFKATQAGAIRSNAVRTTVVAPGQPLPPAAGGAGPVANDTSAPVTRLATLRRSYARGRGPRRLAGTVTEPSGVQVVKLRLTRKRDGRCSWYSGTQERFRGGRCGRAPWFAIGDDPTWSYLLPERLGRGSYTLEAKAVDKAFNRDDQRPARVRFRVR